MASEGRQLQRPRAPRTSRLALAAVLLALALLALALLAARAHAEVVYANPPAADAQALSFEATGTAELGTLVRLAGGARLDPVVRVELANSGPAVAAPITLSLYAVAAGGEPGALLARTTQSFELLAGPSVAPIEFRLPGVALPNELIVSVASDCDAVAVALAGPAAIGTTPREAEGVYRAATGAEPGAAPSLGFEAAPRTWEGRQPAFTVEAAAAPPPVASSATAAAAPTAAAPTAAAPASMSPAPLAPAATQPASRPARREFRIPPRKRMTLSFTRRTARIAGPGVLVQVRCTGASAARCIGTLSLSAAGATHKAPYSIGKGRRQYVVVPLGSDLGLLDRLDAARATVTARTVQVVGGAVKTTRALKLK